MSNESLNWIVKLYIMGLINDKIGRKIATTIPIHTDVYPNLNMTVVLERSDMTYPIKKVVDIEHVIPTMKPGMTNMKNILIPV
jgi:hypothetical protein